MRKSWPGPDMSQATFNRMANPTPDTCGLNRSGNPNWKPGVSGNPSGLPKWRQQLREMFKERSSEFFEAEAMLALGHRIPLKNPDGSQVLNDDGLPQWITPSAKDCLSAIRDLLDRGLGRPSQSIHIDRLDALDASGPERVVVHPEYDAEKTAQIVEILIDAGALRMPRQAASVGAGPPISTSSE